MLLNFEYIFNKKLKPDFKTRSNENVFSLRDTLQEFSQAKYFMVCSPL